MSENINVIEVRYDPSAVTGLFSIESDFNQSSAWQRLKLRVLEQSIEASISENSIELPWPDALSILREFGSKAQQRSLGFRFLPRDEALDRIKVFSAEVKQTQQAKETLVVSLSDEEIEAVLIERGFTERELKPFQLRDIARLASLQHGANFSVPGAGKTTVTFALHVLLRKPGQNLLVVCPKSAFPAWKSIVEECIDDTADDEISEAFTMLEGRGNDILRALSSGSQRFMISYDLMIRNQGLIKSYLLSNQVHLVLDESHRMKAGLASLRGAFLLSIAGLPVRRDILSGTPMPQDASDLASQLGFLWPGQGFDLKIQRGIAPREVLGNLYVRTTKNELNIPPYELHFYDVQMSEGQLALYSVVRSEALRQFHRTIANTSSGPDFVKARKSVMRLLQLSVNPALALSGMAHDDTEVSSGIVDAVIEDGASPKIRTVVEHARKLSESGRKTVIWTIFTDTIRELNSQLADLNPVVIYGGVRSGDSSDPDTREGRLKRFHEDDDCHVLIANPAAAGEGISLHTVCHDAIYADRSYVSTHYLQSIDRIHRLGLDPEIDTHIHIYRTKAPPEIGSIDLSVSRRLALKIRNMQQLLDDPDLHQIALGEEEADDPIDYSVDMQDLLDLVEELEGKGQAMSAEEA